MMIPVFIVIEGDPGEQLHVDELDSNALLAEFPTPIDIHTTIHNFINTAKIGDYIITPHNYHVIVRVH